MSDQPPFDVSEELEVERYELHQPGRYRFHNGRRQFMQTLGAGIVVAVASDRFADRATAQQRRGRRTARRDEPLSDRFHIGEDGVVTLLTSKVEVGQGSRTQLSQAAAEELRMPLDQIRVIMADTALVPDDGGTAGSRTTPSNVPQVRTAAAAMVRVLSGFAASHLEVDAGQVTFAEGTFTAADKQVTLAELAKDATLHEKLKQTPTTDGIRLTPVNRWRILGTSPSKVGSVEVVTGRHIFPSDVQPEGVLYGKILRQPSYGARLTSIDLEPAKQMEGVQVVRDGDFIGVAAPTTWQAGQALAAIAETAKWETTEQVDSDQLFEHLKRTAQDPPLGSRLGRRELAHEISTSYTIAYIQHAPMEPRSAVAMWDEGNVTVWTGTQQPARVHGELRQAFRLAEDQARVIVPDTGGGFGGKHTGETAVEAARLAKEVGRPVSLRWTREEEFTWAYFRPAGLIEVNAGINAAGKLAAWDFTNYNSGRSAVETPYQVPGSRARFVGSDSPLKQGSYRALASTANTFARESAMDDLAAQAEADPLTFRLDHLPDGRLKEVLVACAEKFNWKKRRAEMPPGQGVGIACGTEKGSYVAAAAEVEVVDGKIQVRHIHQAYECGKIINAVNLKAQVEGSIIMGLGGALFEEIHFADGKIKNPNFADYRVPRMFDRPNLEIDLLDRPDLPSVGGSETPIIAIAPAIANAVFQAVGYRCKGLPLKVEA